MFSLRRASAISSGLRAFSTSFVSRDLAKITLVGRLAAEPEISNTSSGKEMIRYVVGVSRAKDKPVAWYRVMSVEPSDRDKAYLATLVKGTIVLVEGDASLTTYEDGEGKKCTGFAVFHRSISTIIRPKPKEATEEES